jgi:hypothetical protein
MSDGHEEREEREKRRKQEEGKIAMTAWNATRRISGSQSGAAPSNALNRSSS